MAVKVGEGDALIVVDVQNDFLPGGALAVPEGDAVVAPLARAIRLFESRQTPVVFTRDWHPLNHCSFQTEGGPWPVHCVQGTHGADFAEGLPVPRDALIVSKAFDPKREAYSGFDGEPKLDAWLSARGVKRVFIGGLATDYCVRATALDARRAGFDVYLLADAVRGVAPETTEKALREMKEAGVVMTTTEELA